LSGWGVDPVVALRLRNAAEYPLPTFGQHGTKLGHLWCEWKIKSDTSGCFDNSVKGDIFLGILSACGVDPVVILRFRNAAENRLPSFGIHGTKLGHSWFDWKMKSYLSGWFDNLEKEEVFGHCEWMCGWSYGCTPLQECCRLPSTYFWTTWHQTRAFLISVNNKKWSFWLVWQFRKRRCVWEFWALAGLIPWLHSALGMLQTTAYLLLGHMPPN